MTKTGSDHLKRQARQIARSSARRYPDVLAELRGTSRRPPSKDLVLLCSGLVHPLDGGSCARPAGRRLAEAGWGWCSLEPHFPAHVWQGYVEARDTAEHAKHEAWLAALSPTERAEYEAEQEAAYWAQMAEEAREPYDPDEERSLEYALDAAAEERWEAEMNARADDDGYIELSDEEYYGTYADEHPR
ncbi:hypothetical protein [Streptomyces triticiradicis]|uniref:Uncharacterized protein n=1 Tax=Streptomyces triticiradicis TaxID=2651189 RepID=A0A7J5D3D4_9ACTN|nr:hypothetical protein [Streptomyces triticiradicis]KAB1978515.1 hypothetical protein F8144_39420 [Streptomyces triticiradicis]